VQEVFSVLPEQLGLANFVVGFNFAVRPGSDPNTAATKFYWDANPVASDFCVTPLDSDEVFSDGERVFMVGLNALVKPFGLLFVCRVEFDAGVALEEPLEPIVFMVEYLALDAGQPHDLCLDDFLHLRFNRQILFTVPRSSDFRGEVTESIRIVALIPALKKRGFPAADGIK